MESIIGIRLRQRVVLQKVGLEEGVTIEFEQGSTGSKPESEVIGAGEDPGAGVGDCDKGDSGVISGADNLGKRDVVRGLRAPVDEQDLVIGVQGGSPGGQSGLKEGGAVATGGDKGDLRGRERGLGDQREAGRRASAVRPGGCVGHIGENGFAVGGFGGGPSGRPVLLGREMVRDAVEI